jgi:hypothetical protein
MTGPTRDRSQSGLDRLLVFVLLAVGLVFVAPYVLGFAGIDVQSGAPPAATADTDHDLQILAARGEAVAGDGSSIGSVRLVVSPAPGRAPVDLREGTAIWIGEETVDLVPVGTSGGESGGGQYTVAAAAGGPPVLEAGTDRGILRFDIGTDDVQDVPEFGTRLQAGDSATVVLVTPHGETVTRRLTVPPDVPPGTDEVWL